MKALRSYDLNQQEVIPYEPSINLVFIS